jgi:proteic killer suppression protein
MKRFHNKETEVLFKRQRVHKWPIAVNKAGVRKLLLVYKAKRLDELRIYPGNCLEKLKGKIDTWSIRINKQYRIIFIWKDDKAWEIEVNKHDKKYGR